jgi:PTS system cellobiose-specific IIC component
VLFSLAAILVITWFVRIWLGFDVAQFIQDLFKPLLVASDTLPAVILESLIVIILWFIGIHGHSIASWNVGILSGFALANLEANAAAFAAGAAIPHVVTPAFRSFFQVGVTTTVPICIILMFRKSAHLKQVGRLAILPGIFDVTEPLWFGMPIILNPFFLIPFILVDVLGLSLTYIVMALGIVPKIVAEVHWAMPGPIGAFLASGGSWITLIWYLILVAIGTFIFYPFIVAYDRHLEKEAAEEVPVTASE